MCPPFFLVISLFCQKNDTSPEFVVAGQTKISYNTKVKSGSMLKI